MRLLKHPRVAGLYQHYSDCSQLGECQLYIYMTISADTEPAKKNKVMVRRKKWEKRLDAQKLRLLQFAFEFANCECESFRFLKWVAAKIPEV